VSTVKVDTLRNTAGVERSTTGDFTYAGMEFYIWYDQQTPAITESLNTSSVDDNNAGDWDANLTSAFSDRDTMRLFGNARTGNADAVWSCGPVQTSTVSNYIYHTASATPTDTDYPNDQGFATGILA
jgi:hypothetical protein